MKIPLTNDLFPCYIHSKTETMSDAYKFHNSSEIYFTTTTVTDWVDVFIRPEYSLIVVKSLQHCIEAKGLNIQTWCLMSNHLHMLVSSKEGFLLEDFFTDFKKYTSKKIVEAIKEMPESRREWMLYRFEYAGKYLNRPKSINSGRMAIILLFVLPQTSSGRS